MNKENEEKKEKILHSVEVNGMGKYLENIMTSDDAVNLIIEYINTHKWFINEKSAFEYSCTQATFSWFETVFRPLMYAMNNSLIYSAFPNSSKLELFKTVSNLHYIKTAGKEYVPYEELIKEYILQESERFFIKILVKFS